MSVNFHINCKIALKLYLAFGLTVHLGWCPQLFQALDIRTSAGSRLWWCKVCLSWLQILIWV